MSVVLVGDLVLTVVTKMRICERISPIFILTLRTRRGGEFVGRYVVDVGLDAPWSDWLVCCSVTLSAGCATGSASRGGVRVGWVGGRCVRSTLLLLTTHASVADPFHCSCRKKNVKILREMQ